MSIGNTTTRLRTFVVITSIILNGGIHKIIRFFFHSFQDGVRDVIEIDHEFGKVMPVPTGREITPGKVWVQWPHDKEPYSYRVGFKGKMDLEIANAGWYSRGLQLKNLSFILFHFFFG